VAEFKIPARRTFIVTRYDRHNDIEEIVVQAHSVSVEDTGALSFVSYYLSPDGNDILPQKHRIFNEWRDVIEEVQFASALVAH